MNENFPDLDRPMVLGGLQLTNFRLFKSLEMDFHPELTVIVAPNGGGKTTVLDAVAAMLKPYVDTLLGGKYSSSFKADDVRVQMMGTSVLPTREALIALQGRLQASFWDEYMGPKGLRWETAIRSRTGGRFSQGSVQLRMAENLGTELHMKYFNWFGVPVGAPPMLPLVAYYPTGRRLSNERVKRPGKSTKGASNRLEGYLDWQSARGFTLFTDWYWRQATTPLEDDLPDGVPGLKARDAVAVANAALQALRPHVCFRRFIWDRSSWGLYVEQDDGVRLPLRVLSDGTIAMLSLLVDLAHRSIRLNPELGVDAPKLTEGFVLIDEVDMHLHPSWQQTVIGSLRTAFPKIQFIVTTHSPQVLSTVSSESIRILGPDGVHSAPAGTQGAEASRILKRVFGVPLRPVDDPVSKLLAEYLRLIDDGQWDTPDALDKRRQLDQAFMGEEPALLEADLRIENLKWEQGK